jgi:cell division septal protein FtsQ
MSQRRTRADAVRERRQRGSQRKYESASSSARQTVRPLISRPRVPEQMGPYRPIRNKFSGMAVSLPRLDLSFLASWRGVSLALAVVMVAAFALALQSKDLYVGNIKLGGASLVPAEEIYAASGIAGTHIFWVDPAAAAAAIEQVPGIKDATVEVAWPAQVSIVVVERVPQVMLVDGSRSWWIDEDGQRYPSRGQLPGLLPIVNETGAELEYLPAEAIAGAMQLRDLRPNIEQLSYDFQRGLSYQDGRGWRGFFGTGTDMDKKLAVYERLVADLQGNGITPRTIDVTNYRTPVYR